MLCGGGLAQGLGGWLLVVVCGGGRGFGTQKSVYQKWPDQMFPICKFHFSHDGHFGLGVGGGFGEPPPPLGFNDSKHALTVTHIWNGPSGVHTTNGCTWHSSVDRVQTILSRVRQVHAMGLVCEPYQDPPVAIVLNFSFIICLFLVQTKMSWRALLTIRHSRQALGIKGQGCPVLR